MLEQLLKEHGSELLSSITQGSDLDATQAQGLLPPALENIAEVVKGGAGGFDLGSLLGGKQDAMTGLLGQLDLGKIAGQAGLSESQTQGGLQSLLPAVMSLLGEKSGGAAGLLSMLGGGGDDTGGTLGALGGLAGKLFGK